MYEVTVDEAVLAEIVQRLVRAVDPDRIILFGSRARGDHRPDSDLDLLLIKPSAAPPHRRVIAAIGPWPESWCPPTSYGGRRRRSRTGPRWALISPPALCGKVGYFMKSGADQVRVLKAKAEHDFQLAQLGILPDEAVSS